MMENDLVFAVIALLSVVCPTIAVILEERERRRYTEGWRVVKPRERRSDCRTLVSPADPPLVRPTPCEQKAEVR